MHKPNMVARHLRIFWPVGFTIGFLLGLTAALARRFSLKDFLAELKPDLAEAGSVLWDLLKGMGVALGLIGGAVGIFIIICLAIYTMSQTPRCAQYGLVIALWVLSLLLPPIGE